MKTISQLDKELVESLFETIEGYKKLVESLERQLEDAREVIKNK